MDIKIIINFIQTIIGNIPFIYFFLLYCFAIVCLVWYLINNYYSTQKVIKRLNNSFFIEETNNESTIINNLYDILDAQQKLYKLSEKIIKLIKEELVDYFTYLSLWFKKYIVDKFYYFKTLKSIFLLL